MNSHATRTRAWRFSAATVSVALMLTSCVSIPTATQQQLNRRFGNVGGIHLTLANRAGPATFLSTASFVSGANPYQPTAMQSLNCGDSRTPITVQWSSADGVADENARLACTLALAAVGYDSQLARRSIPSIGYRLLLVPTGYSAYRRAFSAPLFGSARLTYAFHGGDSKVMRSEIVNNIAHETVHVWAEFYRVPQSRRAGTKEEETAYLIGACAELAVNGTLNAYDMGVPTPGSVATTHPIDRSQRGGTILNHEMGTYFNEGPILQRESLQGGQLDEFCRATAGAFFAP